MAFKIQVVNDEGLVAASWHPGTVSEHEFVSTFVEAIVHKGVGIGTTENQVRQRATEALHELLYNLKRTVKPPAI